MKDLVFRLSPVNIVVMSTVFGVGFLIGILAGGHI